MSEETTDRAVKQWTAIQERDDLRLIPPLAEEFKMVLGRDTERARQWALEEHYLLAHDVPACAHGLYLMPNCPGPRSCRTHFSQLDHARLWIPHNAVFGDRPFLLSHPYSEQVAEETSAYARAHGLDLRVRHIVSDSPYVGDDWYGHGTLPIRMTIPPNWPLWPIEAKAAILLATQPVAWPDDETAVRAAWQPERLTAGTRRGPSSVRTAVTAKQNKRRCVKLHGQLAAPLHLHRFRPAET